MEKDITHVGLDAHQETIHPAVRLPGVEKAVEDQFANTPEAIRRWARRLSQRAPGAVVCCYEAGPLGYGLKRELEGLGLRCVVVAPALIPVRPGDRIKTDRRDARKLAELLRAGLLTEVHAPSAEQEAVRDLARAREAVKRDQIRMRHRLSKFLLRRGVRFTLGRSAWTKAHLESLRSRRPEYAADQAILDDPLLGLEQIESRLTALDAKLEIIARKAPYREPVGWLRCFRGIDTLDRAGARGGAARLATLRIPPRADGVSGPGAERVFPRRQGAARLGRATSVCDGLGHSIALATSGVTSGMPSDFKKYAYWRRTGGHQLIDHLCPFDKLVAMGNAKTKVTVTLPAETLRRARTITGRGITDTIIAGLEALERKERRSALRALKGRVRIDLDLEQTRR